MQTFRPLRFSDGWGIATPTSDSDFAGMCRAFGVEGYDDPRVATIAERSKHREVSSVIIGRCYEAAVQMTTEEAMARLEAQRVPCGVVTSPEDLVDDVHARAVGLFVESDHPVTGRTRLPRHPSLFRGTPAGLGGASPALGEHTDAILAEIGMADRVAELRASGVVA